MVLATTERCGGGNLQKLNYGSCGKPLSSSRPSTTNYGNFGNGRPPPPQNNVEREQLRHSENCFSTSAEDFSRRFNIVLGAGGRGTGVSLVTLLRMVYTIFLGNAFRVGGDFMSRVGVHPLDGWARRCCRCPAFSFKYYNTQSHVLRPVGVIYRCVLAAPPRSLPAPTAVLSEPTLRLVGVTYMCVL